MTTWSNKQLGAALNLTVQRVEQLVKTGILPGPTGKHDPVKAVRAYIAFLNQRLTGGDLKGARIAKYEIETKRRELEYRQRSGELVLYSVVNNQLYAMARTARDRLQTIPSRNAGILAAEKNQEKVFAILPKEIDQALEGLTDENTTNPDTVPAA